MRICGVRYCGNRHVAKSLCGKHYQESTRTPEKTKKYNKAGYHRQYRRKWARAWRNKVFDKLGHRCAKCGFEDKRALHIDHVNNDGYTERQLYRGSGGVLFLKTVLADSAGRYQILCANCNAIKKQEAIVERYGAIIDDMVIKTDE